MYFLSNTLQFSDAISKIFILIAHQIQAKAEELVNSQIIYQTNPQIQVDIKNIENLNFSHFVKLCKCIKAHQIPPEIIPSQSAENTSDKALTNGCFICIIF